MNYLSRPYQPEAVVSRGDLNVDFQVLNTLQTRYDANKAIVDQTIAQYEMLKGLRTSDNEYIANKIAQVKTQIDSYGNKRFEHKSTVDSYTKTLQNVIKDPIVRDAIQSRAVYDNYNAQVAELKKKNPEQYNDANYQYGLYQGGFQDYMSGKTNKLGNVAYTPYTDLNEEHLKKLKTIKDIKGKRFIEEIVDENGNVNPNGKFKRRKEIDGLTEQEISGFFGNMLSSQEINQIKINGWAKYAQPNTIEVGKKLYSDYNNQLIKAKEAQLLTVQANATNKNLGENINREYQRKAEELRYEVDGLKSLDVNKISPDEIAYQLEKVGYVNSISNMASSEWSTSLDVNETYYKDKELELDLMKYDLDVRKFELEKTKLKTEFGVDEFGNPLADGNIAKSARETDLEDMTEDSSGAVSLRKEHDTAYNTIISTAKEFLKNASKEDRENYLKYLKARGINENLEFESEEDKGKFSLADTAYDAFMEGGFGSSYAEYGKAMDYNKKIKNQKAQDIVKVESESYKKVFSQDPDKYITSLKDEIATAMRDGQSDLFEGMAAEDLELAKKAQQFVDDNGGWKGLKAELIKDPSKLSKFAQVLDPLTKRATRTITTNFLRQSLLEDAAEEVEKTIQSKTKSGLMTSVYSDFTFTNDKVKEQVLKMIPNERTFIKGTTNPYDLDRTKTANISFYKKGDDIVVVQEQTIKKGEAPIVTETTLSSADAGYQELLKYVDFEAKNKGIMATSETSLPPVKINMTSHENDEVTKKRKQYAVASTLQANLNLQLPFQWSGMNPVNFAASLATKETAKTVIDEVLKSKGIPQEKALEFRTRLFENINSYKTITKSIPNMSATGYTFGVDVKKGDDTILFTELGTNEIDNNTNYLINSHPQVVFLNQLLKVVNAENVDNYITRF